ncbi:NAD(P)-dependent iron-only hydrogenase iron-sulfur protein [Marinitoga hydrogenitolerans DSM 16785]|uniref:NAD(P)-dependent iron-only hydrogenase iron-sulfur protein n=1 Tax=Marinitoga hydrogenitolerans (strain DSM 16785 / JCM 12826 / AT1271) TaxID=1122195 RepID=A0A1M4ZFL3_MARH1|nr:(2Fe-2S) ferredoxin domain-containing protein [Marinitoga hydrogenitolerans]SHF16833.1 NAD(P)-dependent iron-only hydrogenase iron-sulfur protein [Marinitoga hydrogenitolerans DSM 16785]
MPKIRSLEDLIKQKELVKNKLSLRTVADNENLITLKVAMGTCGIAAGAKETFEKLLDVIEEKGLDNIRVIQTGCMGYCHAEPTVEINEPGKEPILYGRITGEKAKDLIEKHILNGELLQDSIIGETHKSINE